MEERNINQYDFDSSYAQAGLTLNQYVARTFGWMFVGLMITFLLAAVLAMTGAVIYLFVNPYIPMVLLIAELVVVLVLSAGILKRPVGVTRVLFAVYSILNGLVFSAYFVIYDVANLVACERTVLATDSHRFEYADSILTSWQKAGVRHKNDIRALDESHQRSKANRPAASTNKFNQFTQHDYDFDAIQRSLEKKILSN